MIMLQSMNDVQEVINHFSSILWWLNYYLLLFETAMALEAFPASKYNAWKGILSPQVRYTYAKYLISP